MNMPPHRTSSVNFLAAGLLPLVLLLAACQTEPAGGELGDDGSTRPSFLLTDVFIYTGNPDQPVATAMSVQEGRIVAVGDADALSEAHGDLPVLSAAGKTVIPGLIDAHAHLRNLAQMRLSADLVGTGSIEEIIARLKEHEKHLSAGEWLRGRGWDQNDWPTVAFPTRMDLDAAFPDRPVWLERIDGHAMWANTAALQAVSDNLLKGAEAPPGGQLFRLEDGSASGVFIDDAEHLVGVAVPPFTSDALDRGLEMALEEASRYGLTGVHEAGVDTSDINRFIRFADEGRLTVRVHAMAEPGPAFERYCSDHYSREDDLIGIRSVKIYLDGALGSRGAALMQEYSDDPGNHGLMRTAPADFAELVDRALACGYQVNTHAIGDSANRLLLDTYEAARITPEGRHRNEHAQILALDDIDRFATLGIIASMQPTHATSDMYWAEDRLGPHRIKGAYAWRSLLDSGARLAFGSDFPVEQVNPMLGFHAALTRQDDQLWPEGGWYPEERLDRPEVLHAFTLGAAWSGFQDKDTGSLEPGKWADFVVLDRDIMQVAPPAILGTRVEATFVAGRAVHGSLAP